MTTNAKHTPRVRLAWARTGPGHKSVAAPIDHGTRDSRRTLCGIEVGGVDDSAAFDPDRGYSCKRCAKAMKNEAAATDTDRASDVEHEREEADRARVHAALAELEALANDRGAWSPSDAVTHVDRAEELYGMLCRTVYRDGAADCLACIKDRALDVLIAAQHVRDAAQRRADADLAPRLVLMGRAGELRAELRRLADRANDLARAVGPEREWRDVDPVAVQELIGRLDAELVRANDVLARSPAVEGE